MENQIKNDILLRANTLSRVIQARERLTAVQSVNMKKQIELEDAAVSGGLTSDVLQAKLS